ncbi:MAG: RluA family pseudouridine synthase [Ruminococcaceae bacterium]|nr:RluA family pseudouridine synthase [Oscillospiraceae bacterium]
MKEFVIGPNDADQRLDKFVLKATTGLPKSLLYKAIRTKKIKVNRKRCEAGQFLQEGDSVQMFLSPDFFGEREERFLTLAPTLSVVYEDENLLICDKPVGLSCHADEAQETGTLIDHIKAYLVQKGEYCPTAENSFAPALCNRIDRNTSGLVIAAKNALALRELNEMIRDRAVEKGYLALCHGKAPSREGIRLFLKKDGEKNRVSVSEVPREGYLTAVTDCKLLSYDRETDRSLVQIRLHTGRTHQIRATLAHLGHPLVGDTKYGKTRDKDFAFQALRSHRLQFHPRKDSPLSYLADKEILAPEDPKFTGNA